MHGNSYALYCIVYIINCFMQTLYVIQSFFKFYFDDSLFDLNFNKTYKIIIFIKLYYFFLLYDFSTDLSTKSSIDIN